MSKDIRTAACLHCGGTLEYIIETSEWRHQGSETLPFQHAACPDKINPENWR